MNAIESTADDFITNPEEFKVAFWDYILDGMKAVQEETISFEDFNKRVFQASTLNKLALERAVEMMKATRH